jgi:hypothetical protein
LKKKEKKALGTSGSRIKETEGRNKKRTPESSSNDCVEKAENWLKKLFYGILYHRSEKKFYFPDCPKVKLPRSRHK